MSEHSERRVGRPRLTPDVKPARQARSLELATHRRKLSIPMKSITWFTGFDRSKIVNIESRATQHSGPYIEIYHSALQQYITKWIALAKELGYDTAEKEQTNDQ